jgi:hypothetical protein
MDMPSQDVPLIYRYIDKFCESISLMWMYWKPLCMTQMLEPAEYMRRIYTSETSGSVNAVCHMNSLFENILIVHLSSTGLYFAMPWRATSVSCSCVGLCAWDELRWAGVFGEVTYKSKLMCEEIKSRGNAKNACHRSVQSLLPTCLLSAKIKIEFCLIVRVIMPCVLFYMSMKHGLSRWKKNADEMFSRIDFWGRCLT